MSSSFLSSSQVGSPSALSDPDLNQKLRQAAQQCGRTLYVPSGALWGGQDIQRLNDSGTLKVIKESTDLCHISYLIIKQETGRVIPFSICFSISPSFFTIHHVTLVLVYGE